MAIKQADARVELGDVEVGGARLSMSLMVDPDRTARLVIWMGEVNSRRSGEAILLGYEGAMELKELLTHAEETVGRMIATGQLIGLRPGP